MSKTPKRKVVGNRADGFDAFTKWRKVIGWGAARLKAVKNAENRAERRAGKDETHRSWKDEY